MFLELRIEFIDPCFATFYHCQLKVYEVLYKELRSLADANFDMSCSAMNGFVAKWDEASSLLDELTIPRKKSGAGNGQPPALSQSASNTNISIKESNQTENSNNTSFKNAAPLTTISAIGATLPKANNQSKKYVIALYDYEAQAEGDLTFRRDDKIEVLEKTENQNDWWTGKVNGLTGQFPGNYVAEI